MNITSTATTNYGATTSANAMLLIGRVLIGSLFLVNGILKATAFAGAVGYFTKLGFPAPSFMAVLSIVIEIGGGVLMMIGWRTRWAAWLLILFVLIATAMAHRFWEYDVAQRANQIFHFTKNLAIIGGLLYVVAFGPGSTSVDKR